MGGGKEKGHFGGRMVPNMWEILNKVIRLGMVCFIGRNKYWSIRDIG